MDREKSYQPKKEERKETAQEGRMKETNTAHEEQEEEKIAEEGIVREGDDALGGQRRNRDRDRDLRLQKNERNNRSLQREYRKP